MSMHIAVAGNIGSGKTTLTTLLAKNYGWKPHYEDTEDNPYLDDFYKNMKGWSFNLQIYFLNSRLSRILEIRKSQETVIQDRTIYEDAYIFAPNLRELDLMSTRDFENYFSLFTLMTSLIAPPDLIIYFENSIRLDYLQRLNHRYETWVRSYNQGRIITVDVDKYRFTDNNDDLRVVINKIDAELNGLFKN